MQKFGLAGVPQNHVLGAENGHWDAIASGIAARDQFTDFIWETEHVLNGDPKAIDQFCYAAYDSKNPRDIPAGKASVPAWHWATGQAALNRKPKESLTSGIDGERDGRWQFPKHPAGVEYRIVSTAAQVSRFNGTSSTPFLSQVDK